MAFVWIQGTAVDDIIHKADIDEIHTNIDSIKDNLANITYYITDNANEKDTHNATKYTTHDATQYTGRDSAHYTSNNSSNNGSYYGNLNSTIQVNHDSEQLSSHDKFINSARHDHYYELYQSLDGGCLTVNHWYYGGHI